jgi:type II secretory pathway predicted ATPase ExeA/cell division septation protein DedD
MPFQTEPGSMTYEAFFGLKEKPFSLASDPRFLYLSPSHTAAYDKLLAGIRRREGLLVLTGDIGTGKTTLCRAALQGLDRKTFSAFVPDPFASREDLLKILLIDFGVTTIRDLTTGPLKNASRTELSYLLSAFLDTLAPLEAFVVVLIDEAQNMSAPLIEEIRILSDANARKSQLQVVFVGQLELHERLKLPEMRQVDQRVCLYCRLDPLGAGDVRGYVHHRLHVAGGTHDRVHFFSDALERLFVVSRGVPRLINRICDRALYVAYLKRTTTVDLAVLEAAIQEMEPELVPGISTARVFPTPVESPPVPVVPAPTATGPSERIDEWLKQVDVDAARIAPLPRVELESSRPAPPEPDNAWREAMLAELQPETHLRRLRRRWFKRARTAAWHLAVWSAIGVGAVHALSALAGSIGPSVQVSPSDFITPSAPEIASVAEPAATPQTPSESQVSTEPQAPDTGVPADPQVAVAPAAEAGADGEAVPATEPHPAAGTPDTAAAPSYVVEVALFATTARADRLGEVLAGEGFMVYQRPLTLSTGRVLQQVLLGPYATRADAVANLQRLQQSSGYEDARVAEVAPR